jgi:hypothetical protein
MPPGSLLKQKLRFIRFGSLAGTKIERVSFNNAGICRSIYDSTIDLFRVVFDCVTLELST